MADNVDGHRFDEPTDGRNVFVVPETRAVIRTKDVYQTVLENGVTGYSETLLAIVANFKNSGKPDGFNCQSMVGKSKRGEVALRLFAVVDPDTRTFLRVGFKSRGCLAMTGCASTICHMIEGKTFEEALAITPEDVSKVVDGVPVDKKHTLYFATEGVKALVGDYLYRNGATIADLDKIVPCVSSSVACLLCEHCSLRDTRIDMVVDAMRTANEA